jgi:urea carboxylase
VQVWNRFRRAGLFQEHPWALRFFDRIQWYPVSAEELEELRADTGAGRAEFETVEGEFSIADYELFLKREADSIAEFRARQSLAFDAEKQRWRAAGEFDRQDADQDTESGPGVAGALAAPELPPGATPVAAPFLSTVWQLLVEPGTEVTEGEKILAVEAMKMESTVLAPCSGRVLEIYAKPGDQVAAGQVLLTIGAGA